MAKKCEWKSNSKVILSVLFWIMVVFKRTPKMGMLVLFFVIIGYAIYYFISKTSNSDKYETAKKDVINKKINNNYSNIDSRNDETQLIAEGYNMKDSQRRLENLKRLYESGLMDKEEYDEKRKKMIENV